MATSAWCLPGIAVNLTGTGTVAWANASAILIDDTTKATFTAGAGSIVSNYLRAYGFNFGVPWTATIDGIEVEITKHESAASGNVADNIVQIRNSSGTIVGNNKAVATEWSTTSTNGGVASTYGGAADNWGLTLTGADLASEDWGIVLSAKTVAGAATVASVDFVRVRIYYTLKPGETLGTDLVSNGTFATVTTGWTPQNATLSVVSTTLEVNATSTSGTRAATQNITTVSGRKYRISGRFRSNVANIATYVTVVGSSLFQLEGTYSLNFNNFSFDFTADSSTTTVFLQIDAFVIGQDSYFDDIACSLVLDNYTLTAATGAFLLAGQTAATRATRKLVAGTGAFVWARQDAAVKVGRRIAGATGAFVWAGIDATLTKSTALTHYVLTAAAGAFTLAGQAAGTFVGRKIAGATGAFVLAGQTASLRATRRIAAETGAFLLAGQTASLKAARKIVGATGVYTLAGQAANTLVGRKIVAAAGAFVLAGQTAGVFVGRKILGATGTFSLSGQTATLRATRKLVAAAGAYTLAGQTAFLRFGYKFVGGTGAFVWTGVAATLRATRLMDAETGDFTVAGQNAVLRAARQLLGAKGSFTEAGQTALMRIDRRLVCDTGIFVIGGQTAQLKVGRRIVGGTGTFTLAGQDATLTKGDGLTHYTLTAGTGVFVVNGIIGALIYSGAGNSIFGVGGDEVVDLSIPDHVTEEAAGVVGET
jgi:hypothetical protein